MKELSEKELVKDLKLEAKALKIPSGAAEEFIRRTVKEAMTSLKGRKVVTEKDLQNAVYRGLKKYHADLAYVYKNRDTIV